MGRSVLLGAVCATIVLGSTGRLCAQAEQLLFTENAQAELQTTRTDLAPKLRLPPRTSADSATTKSRSMTPTASLWGTVAAVAIVFVGLMLLARVLRRHGPAGLRSLPSDVVEPLGQRILSRGVSVHLVRCGTRVLLVGVGPDGVRTLCEINEPMEVDLLTGACHRNDKNGRSFVNLFQREQGSAPAAQEAPAAFGRGSGRAGRSAMTEVDGV